MTETEYRKQIVSCYRGMYAVAFRIFRNVDDASDAVQETMTRLWEKRTETTLPDNPAAFCNVAVRNTCLNMLRQRRFDSLEGIDLPSASPTDAGASYNSALSHLRSLLADFPEKQRKILILSFISQLSNTEITEATGESEANVRQILSRGRQKLKTLLSHELQ